MRYHTTHFKKHAQMEADASGGGVVGEWTDSGPETASIGPNQEVISQETSSATGTKGTAMKPPDQEIASPRHFKASIKTTCCACSPSEAATGAVTCVASFAWRTGSIWQQALGAVFSRLQQPVDASRVDSRVDSHVARDASCCFAIAKTKSGGVTWLALAHARRSAGVLQQQERQHCSAVRQPHVPCMHGNRSVP